jgi:hypothetical protein
LLSYIIQIFANEKITFHWRISWVNTFTKFIFSTFWCSWRWRREIGDLVIVTVPADCLQRFKSLNIKDNKIKKCLCNNLILWLIIKYTAGNRLSCIEWFLHFPGFDGKFSAEGTGCGCWVGGTVSVESVSG